MNRVIELRSIGDNVDTLNSVLSHQIEWMPPYFDTLNGSIGTPNVPFITLNDNINGPFVSLNNIEWK